MTWLSTLSDELLAALLLYGYPVLGLTLLAGAIGLPLPSGLATVVAGALAAQGRLSWLGSGLVAVVASVVGDMVGYSVGRLLGREFLDRRGRWVGLTSARLDDAEAFFQRWGGLSVLLSRSLLSFLSPAVNLLAGASGYRLRSFLPFDVAGRLAWTVAYLGLGYEFGGSVEAAADFLSSLSGLLVSLGVLIGLLWAVYRRRRRPVPDAPVKPDPPCSSA
ncbi:MAG: DedA family protein [Chloroflexi bacterium]|nr:DedA family protein [Chloroflexota bacterium]